MLQAGLLESTRGTTSVIGVCWENAIDTYSGTEKSHIRQTLGGLSRCSGRSRALGSATVSHAGRCEEFEQLEEPEELEESQPDGNCWVPGVAEPDSTCFSSRKQFSITPTGDFADSNACRRCSPRDGPSAEARSSSAPRVGR